MVKKRRLYRRGLEGIRKENEMYGDEMKIKSERVRRH